MTTAHSNHNQFLPTVPSMHPITKLTTHFLHCFVAWLNVLVLAIFMATNASAQTKVTYFHNDLSGNPVAASNSTGQIIWRESYRPYGERLKNEAASQTNSQWYTGHRQDVDTGLVYMGARHYDPLMGRFLSIDPAGFDEGNPHSFNRYAYANNNPMKYVDPDGRAAALAWGIFATAAVGAVGYSIISHEDRLRINQGVANVVRGGADALGGFLTTLAEAGNAPPSQEKPSLVDAKGEAHILDGDKTGGGHRSGTGKKGKSEFPSGWSDEKILGEISDVATDPASAQKPAGTRTISTGARDGVDIRTVSEPGRIVTGYPINTPRNP